ncbi:peroxisomal ATPase PEX6-like [Curcuma longa]|uniref:peroxisomal ATPase PEX6-like n=1 Tax=Curcuma longa TaxID=136217 RepID=UPI003D9E12A0
MFRKKRRVKRSVIKKVINKSNLTTTGKSELRCYGCNRKGHFRVDYPNQRKDQRTKKKALKATWDESSSEELNEELTTTSFLALPARNEPNQSDSDSGSNKSHGSVSVSEGLTPACILGARSASPFLSTVVLLHTTAFLDEALSNADLRHRILSSARWAIPSASPASVPLPSSPTLSTAPLPPPPLPRTRSYSLFPEETLSLPSSSPSRTPSEAEPPRPPSPSPSSLGCIFFNTSCYVLVKNSETNVGRVAKAKVLDRPLAGDSQAISVSCSTPVMNILPSFTYSPEVHPPINQEVAYVTPMLAFNLGIHVTCLMVLVCGGQDSLMSWFEVEGNKQEKRDYPPLYVELFPWPNCPKYASHLRISFVKIPECGVLESCRGKSVIEEGDRQDLIDLALNEYFSVDRFLARGDIFYVHVDWHCHSEMCVSCNQKTPKGLSSNIIYFKVMSMEPLDELILRVNCNQTTLVLGGSVASAIPPMGLIANYDEFKPIHVETVKTLTSILIPALCPSALLSKFRVAVFLYGSAGCGKRTVVRYVARHLGVHVIEYSCHDFIESSEKKVSAALTNAFKVASR